MASRWTDEERAYLRERYPSDGPTAVARALGRGVPATRRMAGLMGVKKARHEWTEADDEWLREHYAEAGWHEAARRFGVTKEAAAQRARAVGASGSHHFWTTGEMGRIRSLRERGASLADIARMTGLSRGAVQDQLLKMGLGCTRREWSPDEDRVLRRVYPAGGVPAATAVLRRSRHAVQKRAKALGVPYLGPYAPKEKVDRFVAACRGRSAAEVASYCGREVDDIRERAARLGVELAA